MLVCLGQLFSPTTLKLSSRSALQKRNFFFFSPYFILVDNTEKSKIYCERSRLSLLLFFVVCLFVFASALQNVVQMANFSCLKILLFLFKEKFADNQI